MRVLFIGAGDIGLPSLRWLIESPKHAVAAVAAQPDKPAGRKQILTPPQTKVIAQAAGIPVLQPPRIRDAVAELAALRPDVAVVVAYGQILSREVLAVPRHGCLNIHASLLPKYRGASPVQAAIREGDAETGVTIMFMDEGLDTGDILLADRLPIAANETGGSLHDKLAALAPHSLERALDLLAAGEAPRIPQDSSLATKVGKLSREHGRIDWRRPAAEIERMIRAYNPWPGAFCSLPGDSELAKPAHLKIHAASLIDGEACPQPGAVVAADARSGIIVSCGSGLLRLDEVQAEGGKRLKTEEFLRGHAVAAGAVLG